MNFSTWILEYKRRISYYTYDQAWVIFFLLITIFLLVLIKNPFKIQLKRSYFSGSSLIFEIRGKIKYPGFYCYRGLISTRDAIERGGGLSKSTCMPSIKMLSTPVVNGSEIIIEDTLRVVPMEPEKFIIFFIPFDVNQATATQLNAIPGIGEKLSYNILAYRTNKGCFKSMDELKNVPGIGDTNFHVIKKYLSLHS